MAVQITTVMKCSSQALKGTSHSTRVFWWAASTTCTAPPAPTHARGNRKTCPSRASPITSRSTPSPQQLQRKSWARIYITNQKTTSVGLAIHSFCMAGARFKAVPASLPTEGAQRPPHLPPRSEQGWQEAGQEGKPLHVHCGNRWACLAVVFFLEFLQSVPSPLLRTSQNITDK